MMIFLHHLQAVAVLSLLYKTLQNIMKNIVLSLSQSMGQETIKTQQKESLMHFN